MKNTVNYQFLGEGTYGSVYRFLIAIVSSIISPRRAFDKLTGRNVAVKRFKPNDEPGGGFAVTSLREISILKSLRYHENICHLIRVQTFGKGIAAAVETAELIFELADMDLGRSNRFNL
jgi:serine/threonine protein kinase